MMSLQYIAYHIAYHIVQIMCQYSIVKFDSLVTITLSTWLTIIVEQIYIAQYLSRE